MARVLLIDDDAATLRLTATHLARAGHQVEEFGNGLEALERVLADPPDIIVSDIYMPGLDGFGVLSALRAQIRTGGIPLIFLTSRSDHGQFRKAMRLGADDFLTKPIDPRELIEAIAARLVRSDLIKSAPLPLLSSGARASFDPGRVHPAELGGFAIEAEIAAGGSSTIYLARDPSQKRQVALKVIRLESGTPPDVLERFINEHQMLERLKHPNIVPIYAQGFRDDLAYIAMEYFPRGSLTGLLRGSLSEDAVLWITRQVAAGLEAAHRAGIVHRDMKPDNVMLRADGSLALADFGIAKNLNTGFGKTTDHGLVLGTPTYMPPEQALGNRVDASADVYSLGVMVYQMLTGEKPFDAGDFQGIIYKHINAPVPRLPSTVANWQGLVDRMLAKSPRARPPDASVLLAALRDFR